MSKLAFTVAEAAEASSLGRTSIFELIKQKRLKAHKRGMRTLILAADLESCLRSLPVAGASDISEAA